MFKNWYYIFFLLLMLSSCHVGRFFVYNFADHTDYKKFPERVINAPEETFYFNRTPKTIQPTNFPKEFGSFEAYQDANKSLCFTIIRNDTILYDWYTKRKDTSSIMTTFSMAKSFVGLLIGIAIEENHIDSVSQSVCDYLPELDREKFGTITIEHLLNMQSGIYFNESYYNPFGTVAKFYYGKHLLHYIKRLKVEKPPGQGFDYRSLDTQLLGLIIERATGKKLARYFEEKIWQPLNMQYNASWSIDSKRGDTEKAFCCLNARAIDLAKIGKLMLQKGRWNQEQIVPKAWVEHCFQSNSDPSYSYQWWILEPKKEIMAQGILGQYLYINPEKNIVMVRMGKKWGKDINWWSYFSNIASEL